MQLDDTDQPKPIEDVNIIRSGRLQVGGGHELYWVDWGNRRVTQPIFYMHGGPGAGFSERDFKKFDPLKHRVIFHDQRGSGRSTPFTSTEHNTTSDLISDINKLKSHLGFDKMSLYGTSWGSTLALLYAIAHPKYIEKMLIGGIYLARKIDNDFYLKGRINTHFPEVWERFIAHIPKEYQENPADYYKQMLAGNDSEVRHTFAMEWMLYESSILKLDYVPAKVEENITSFASESLAFLEAYYLLNGCFIDENYILDHVSVLDGLEKIVIVQGRYDFICMPRAAYELKAALGSNAQLHFVTSGHSSGDSVQREVLRAYANMLW